MPGVLSRFFFVLFFSLSILLNFLFTHSLIPDGVYFFFACVRSWRYATPYLPTVATRLNSLAPFFADSSFPPMARSWLPFAHPSVWPHTAHLSAAVVSLLVSKSVLWACFSLVFLLLWAFSSLAFPAPRIRHFLPRGAFFPALSILRFPLTILYFSDPSPVLLCLLFSPPPAYIFLFGVLFIPHTFTHCTTVLTAPQLPSAS